MQLLRVHSWVTRGFWHTLIHRISIKNKQLWLDLFVHSSAQKHSVCPFCFHSRFWSSLWVKFFFFLLSFTDFLHHPPTDIFPSFQLISITRIESRARVCLHVEHKSRLTTMFSPSVCVMFSSPIGALPGDYSTSMIF